LVFVLTLEEFVVDPPGSLLVVVVTESEATFLPWSLVTVVLLESVVVDCWANIAAVVMKDTRISFFMPVGEQLEDQNVAKR
jgi:hypothetical protein